MLFTHSYYHGTEPQQNPLSDYVDAFAVCVAYPSAGSSQNPTPEYLQLKTEGFVFCKWLDVNGSIMLLAKPSKQIGKCAAMVLNSHLINDVELYRVVVTYYHGSDISATYTKIAGDVQRAEVAAAAFEFRGNAEDWIRTHKARLGRARECYQPAYKTTISKLAEIKAGEFKLNFKG